MCQQGHRFVLASASPVFHRILYEASETETKPDSVRKIVLGPDIQVLNFYFCNKKSPRSAFSSAGFFVHLL